MKLKILLLTLFISLFVFVAPAQDKTISDVETEKVLNDPDIPIAGQFPEKRITGKVVGVHDGDTATVLDAEKRQYKFRFNGIDAPELKMDFGQKSKQNLSDMIFGKEVTVIFSKVDKYGRYVGNIFIDGKDVNLEQIKVGLAWHYKKYAGEQTEKDRLAYSDAETKAKEAKLGLWAQLNPTPPWEYRTGLKAKQEENRANREYFVGAKGGCYYINSSGNKSYVDKKYCDGIPTVVKTESKKADEQVEKPKEEKQSEKPKEKKEEKKSGDRTYILGPRGGCYYMDGDKKVYVKDKSLCGD